MIEKLVMMLLKMLVDYLLDPANVKKLFKMVLDYVDKKAKEQGEDVWDVLDRMFDEVFGDRLSPEDCSDDGICE